MGDAEITGLLLRRLEVGVRGPPSGLSAEVLIQGRGPALDGVWGDANSESPSGADTIKALFYEETVASFTISALSASSDGSL